MHMQTGMATATGTGCRGQPGVEWAGTRGLRAVGSGQEVVARSGRWGAGRVQFWKGQPGSRGRWAHSLTQVASGLGAGGFRVRRL